MSLSQVHERFSLFIQVMAMSYGELPDRLFAGWEGCVDQLWPRDFESDTSHLESKATDALIQLRHAYEQLADGSYREMSRDDLRGFAERIWTSWHDLDDAIMSEARERSSVQQQGERAVDRDFRKQLGACFGAMDKRFACHHTEEARAEVLKFDCPYSPDQVADAARDYLVESGCSEAHVEKQVSSVRAFFS